jgi:O-antigen/teichoic acid export membrane protein
MFRAYAYAYIVSNVLAFILGGVLIRLPLTNAAESQHRAGIVRLLKLTKYFFLFNVLGIVYTRLDLFLIEKYLSISQVGSYRAVNQLVESIYFIPTSISVTLLPLFSRLFVQSGGKLHAFFNLVTKQIAFLGAIISIASYFFAEDIVRLLYGVKYQSGVEVLKLFSFIFPIYFVNNFLGNLLIAIKQEKKQFKSFVISFCIKIASLFAFINLLGLQGAVIAALIAECSMLFWQYFFTQKNSYRIKLDRRDGIVILLLLVLCGVVSIQFHTVVTLSLFVAAGASYVYFAVVSLKRNLTTAKEGGVG